jgi:fumarylacetoacetase-like protein
MQNFNTDDMAHKIPRCIEWITSIHTLHPGDILATGTNHRGLNPFMDGDTPTPLHFGGRFDPAEWRTAAEQSDHWKRTLACPRAASGHAAAAPPRSVMTSRRFIQSPRRRAAG